MKRELVALTFFMFLCFFALYVFVVSECLLHVGAATNNSTLVGLYTFGGVIYKSDFYLSTQLQATPH